MAALTESVVTTQTGRSTLPATVPLSSGSPSLFHHSLVTKDSERLKFQAAAALQLQFGQRRHEQAAASDHRLIVSPYNDEPHLLDLTRYDVACQLLAKALTIFKPIRDDYATAPYLESFNWQAVFDFLRDLAAAEGYRWEKRSFYVVTFRSQLYPDIDEQWLTELDVHSHREATESGGLLKYWFGTKSGENRNLATCVWRSKADAHAGGTGPWHRKARAAAPQLYKSIVFKTWDLVIDDDVSSWSIHETSR